MSEETIVFRDHQGQSVLTFYDLVYSPDDILDRFGTSLTIDHNGFTVKMDLTMDRSDLEVLRNGLQQMLDSFGKYSTLYPDGEQFQLLCEQGSAGDIRIQVSVSDPSLMNKLEMHFASDRFFIRETLTDLNRLLEKNAKTR